MSGIFTQLLNQGSSSARSMESVVLYVVFGQSNVGRAPVSGDMYEPFDPGDDVLDRAIDEVQIFQNDLLVFQSLEAGVNNIGNGGNAGEFGLAVSIGVEAYLDTGKTSYMVKSFRGGSTLFQLVGGVPDWSELSTGELYDILVSDMQNAIASLTQAGKSVTEIRGVFMQGENDAINATRAAAYEDNCNDMFAALRLIFPGMKIVTPQIRGDQDAVQTHWNEVNTAKANVATGDALTVMATATDLALSGDGVHFNNPSQITLGERCHAAFLTI